VPKLFGKVLLPEVVRGELQAEQTPERVRNWIANPPKRVPNAPAPPSPVGFLSQKLGAGELSAIALALPAGADFVMMDDRLGRAAAARSGLRTIGTIGLIDRAALRGLIDARSAVSRLRQTKFRCPPEMLERLLAQHGSQQAPARPPDDKPPNRDAL
jgi:predicted nucleic acid-binding protein